MRAFFVFFFPLLFLATLVSEAARPKPNRTPSSTNREPLLRILSAENQRTLQDPYLASAIHHPTPSIRQAAIFAVARIGDSSFLDELSNELNSKRGTNKKDIVFALGLIPDETAVTIAVQHLAMQKDPELQSEFYVSIGRGGTEKNVQLFSDALQNVANPMVLKGVCRGLGLLWAKDSEDWAVPVGIHTQLIQRVRQGAIVEVPCAFALSRFKGPASHIPSGELVKVAEEPHSSEAEVFLLRALSKITTPAATALLVKKTAPYLPAPIRVEAFKSLGAHPFSKSVLNALRTGLDAPQNAVVWQGLETLQQFGTEAKECSPALRDTFAKTNSKWIRGKILKTGIVVDPEIWKPLVLKEIANSGSEIRPAAASALTHVPSPADFPLVVTLLQDSSPAVGIEVVENIAAWPEDVFSAEIKTGLRAALEKKDPAIVTAIAGLIERFRWKDFGAALAGIYSNLGKPDLDSKVAVLSALGALGDSSYAPTLESGLKDGERLVASAAAKALRETSRRPEGVQPATTGSKPAPFSVTSADLQNSVGAQVVLKTTRGDVQIKMIKEAPMNAVNFVRLVNKKFYDGLVFHRVVPGFVAQGGDPRGDGFGGPGYSVRDEFSPVEHARGTVGLATTAKDTGGSQFFINLASNLHLSGRYTVFAVVTKGMDVADRLEVGDKILSARLVP